MQRLNCHQVFINQCSRPIARWFSTRALLNKQIEEKKSKAFTFHSQITYVSLFCFFLNTSQSLGHFMANDLSLRPLLSLKKKNSSSVETLWSQLRSCFCLIKANNLVMMTSIAVLNLKPFSQLTEINKRFGLLIELTSPKTKKGTPIP